MTAFYQQLIGGEWGPASTRETRSVINPATEEAVAEVPYGAGADCAAAIDAAQRAFAACHRGRRTSAARSSSVSLRRFALTPTNWHGPPFSTAASPSSQARGEWIVSADLFDCHAEEGKPAYGRVVPSRIGTRRLTVLHQPIGVVGIITAWNCPAYNVARAASAALAAGCTVVIRPSEFTPMTAIDMARILLDAGTSAGIVNVVNGDPEAMGQEMLRHPACRKVHLTVGWKESGMGGECGSEGLEEYLETKLVAVGGV